MAQMIVQNHPQSPLAPHTPFYSVSITMGSETRTFRFEKKLGPERILVGRKTTSRETSTPQPQLKATFPLNPRLSTNHALLTFSLKNSDYQQKALSNIFRDRFQPSILRTILGYIRSDMNMTIRDLGSSCGSYIPKNRPLGIQQFWLVEGEKKYSFGVYFISSPEGREPGMGDEEFLRYLRGCHVVCQNQSLKARIAFMDPADSKEVSDILKIILLTYSVVVLSHKSAGYVFIVEPNSWFEGVGGCFSGRVAVNKLEIQSSMVVYTNITKERPIRNREYSDAYKIKTKECLILGEEICYVRMEM